jgi:hypothetical protein
MPHEYTRQRQGRDFSLHKYLIEAMARSRREFENAARTEETKKSLQHRLQQYKKEAAQSAVPIDGHEPAPELPAPERGRNLV